MASHKTKTKWREGEKKKIFRRLTNLKTKKNSKMVIKGWKLKSLPVFLKNPFQKCKFCSHMWLVIQWKINILSEESQRQRLYVKGDEMSLDWTIIALSEFHTNGNKSTKSWKKEKRIPNSRDKHKWYASRWDNLADLKQKVYKSYKSCCHPGVWGWVWE